MMPGIALFSVYLVIGCFKLQEWCQTASDQLLCHAYGGAKTGMEKALATIAPEGWLPMAAAGKTATRAVRVYMMQSSGRRNGEEEELCLLLGAQ